MAMMRRLLINSLAAIFTFVIGLSIASLWHREWQQLPEKTKIIRLDHGPSVPSALSDFVFVGADASAPDIISHDCAASTLPKTLEVGQKYIFHRENRIDNIYMFEELQNRLRKDGITILDARPGSLRCGLPFSISFRDGKYVGRISNAKDHQIMNSDELSRRWWPDDYILTFHKIVDD